MQNKLCFKGLNTNFICHWGLRFSEQCITMTYQQRSDHMNEIKLAILRDMGLNNNGYAKKQFTVVNVRNAVKASTLSEVNTEFNSLVSFGHLKLLGKDRDGHEFYCLPEKFALVKMMMVDLTRGL